MLHGQKKFYILCLLLTIFAIISGCKKDEESEPGIRAPKVSSVTISDIRNQGDPTDLQIAFTKVIDEANISTYRVIIVPSGTTLNLEEAEQLTSGLYVTVQPNNANQSVTLPLGARDHSGESITEENTYQAYVLSMADGKNAQLNALSDISEPTDLLSNQARMERVIESEFQKARLNSLALAIVVNGEEVWSNGYGINKIENQISSTENSLYVASSISKLVVGVALMQQYEKGNIDFEEDISTYLGYTLRNPNFPNVPITVKSVYSHQSSLANPTGQESIPLNTIHTDSVFSMEDWMKSHLVPGESSYNPRLWKNIAPNTQHSNSNLGVTLLAHLVEKTSGMGFRTYARTNIFSPLNMSGIHYRMSIEGSNDESLLTDIFNSSGGLLPNYFEGALYPAGWIRVSVSKLSNFLIAITNGGEFEGNRILQQSSINKMLNVEFPQANLAFNSGVGVLWRAYANNWIGHTAGGIVTGSAMINPETKDGFVIMTNKRGALTVSPDPNLGKIYQAVEEFIRNY